MTAHAKLSPSGAHRWIPCPGSIVLEAGIPDTGSSYAREGTAAHELAAGHLQHGWVLADYVGEVWNGEEPDGTKWQVPITQAMVDYVMDYVKLVREYADGKTLLVERRVSIAHLTGEHGATGTSDAVIVDGTGRTLTVIDLKYGMGVAVEATDNPQLMMYALGALHDYGMLADFEHVCMVIHMPRLNTVSEWTIPVLQLLDFAETVVAGAAEVRAAEEVNTAGVALTADGGFLFPGEKQCRFCRAKAICPALRAEMTDIVGGAAVATAEDFAQFVPQPVDHSTGDNFLPVAMAKVGLVEDWCKAVRAEVERRLLAGKTVDGFKLVTGKKGPRKWADEKAVEKLFKSFRLKQDEMYEQSLISPTKAEKVLTSARWDKAQAHIVQTAGKPSVAPATDKRPALPVADIAAEFRDLSLL